MGRILYKYMAKEVVTPFILSLFITTFVVFMFQILKLAELVVNYGVGLLEVGKVLLFSLPPLFVFTVPMSFLLAVMLAVNRLSGDSELTAMKAAGVSLYQMLPPVMILSVVIMFLTFGLTLFAEPLGKQAIKRLLVEFSEQKAALSLISERVFVTEFEGIVLYANEINPATGTLEKVFIADEQNEKARGIVTARIGRFIQEKGSGKIILQLENGAIHLADNSADSYETISFEKFERIIDLNKAIGGKGIITEYHELNMFQLSAYINELKQKQGDTFDMRRAWVEFHRRFAFPFAAIIFGLVALPLGLAPPRSGKSRGFSVAIIVLCVYYLLFRVGENLGWKGAAHPVIVMWTPNLIFAVFGILLIYKKANESPIRSIEFLAEQMGRAKDYIGNKLFKKKSS